ncbi:MAG: hypothetical protein ACR2O0_01680 [Rhizobiaceae bacterium]
MRDSHHSNPACIFRLPNQIDSSTRCKRSKIRHLPFTKSLRFALGIGIIGILSACQTGSPSKALSLNSKQDATAIMVIIANAAQTCWFKSKDIAFRSYRLANEVNSPAGRPRILLVPKSDPSALPLLVIQAEKKGDTATGNFTEIQTFGPILSTSSGSRITNDVKRWSSGNEECR